MEAEAALVTVEKRLDVSDVELGPQSEAGYQQVEVHTRQGTVEIRHYPAPGATRGVVWVGGVGGGFDSPGRDLYPTLAATLVGEAVSSARVRFRRPGVLEESLVDCLAGLWYLRGQGATRLAAVGHSFGGAVVIQAAAADPTVVTVATLATQAYGADAVTRLGRRCSLLAVHGSDDEILPADCSRRVHAGHSGDARLIVYEGAGHVLDEVAAELSDSVLAWLVEQLVDDPTRSG